MSRTYIKMMKQVFSILGILVLTGPGLNAQPSPIYINLGSITETPQIDALAFYNAGNFNVGGFSVLSEGLIVGGFTSGSTFPYATQNTLNWTNDNSGVMGTQGGFLFDYATPTARHPAQNFINMGTIGAGDIIIANATNIFSSGFLLTGREGLIRLTGDNIDLTRSGLAVSEFTPQFNFRPASPGFGTNFFHTQGVQDVYWGVGTNGFIDPQGQVRGLTLASLTPPPSSGPHDVITLSGFTNTVVLPFDTEEYIPFVWTNAPTETNAVVQIVYVPTNHTDTNFATQVRFASQPGQDFSSPIVEFTLTDIDVVTGDQVTNYVYFMDFLPTLAPTNIFLQNNQGSGTLKPSNYRIERTEPFEWLTAAEANTEFDPELVTHPNAVSTDVTNYTYTAYSATIDQIDSGTFNFFNPVARALFDPTNQTGRIEIDAKTLDLSQSRIRAAGLVTLKAEELIGTGPAKFDASLVSLELKTVDVDSIKLDGLLQDSVRRLSGQVWAWSTGFTNQLVFEEPDPDNPEATTSNTVDVVYNILILQREFQTQVPVRVRDLDLKSKTVELVDNLRIGRSVNIEAEEITIQSLFSAPGGFLAASNLPNVVKFENNGFVSVERGIFLGSDRTNALESIVNSGIMSANQNRFASKSFENTGTIISGAGVASIDAEDILFDGGLLSADANIDIKSQTLLLNGSTITAGTNAFAKITLDVESQLTDSGIDNPNLLYSTDGISILTLPTTSDLLGTTLRSEPNRFREVIHLWPAEDKGGSAEAYENNLALGVLSLKPELFTLHRFSGNGPGKALYVDFLEWDSEQTDEKLMVDEFLASIEIDEDFKIYYADSNLPQTELSNVLDGRLVWVPDFVGPNSGEEVIAPNGTSVLVNRGLANSPSIDTDGDGVANRYDSDPFSIGKAKLEINHPHSTGGSVISWYAMPGASYRLEATDSLISKNWSTVQVVSNMESTLRKISVETDTTEGSGSRFYRIVTE